MPSFENSFEGMKRILDSIQIGILKIPVDLWSKEALSTIVNVLLIEFRSFGKDCSGLMPNGTTMQLPVVEMSQDVKSLNSDEAYHESVLTTDQMNAENLPSGKILTEDLKLEKYRIEDPDQRIVTQMLEK